MRKPWDEHELQAIGPQKCDRQEDKAKPIPNLRYFQGVLQLPKDLYL